MKIKIFLFLNLIFLNSKNLLAQSNSPIATCVTYSLLEFRPNNLPDTYFDPIFHYFFKVGDIARTENKIALNNKLAKNQWKIMKLIDENTMFIGDNDQQLTNPHPERLNPLDQFSYIGDQSNLLLDDDSTLLFSALCYLNKFENNVPLIKTFKEMNKRGQTQIKAD